jgi:hypothetical protein
VEERHHDGQLVVWGSAEYLLWWVKNQPVSAPLVTTGDPATLGVLGAPGTAVLFGGSDIDYHTFSGGRFTLGIGWGSNCDCTWGVEGSGFFLEKRPSRSIATSSIIGVPVLARPFFDTQTGESALLISAPNVAHGSVEVASYSDLYSWDVDLVASGYRDGALRIDWLGGFRYLNLSETLDVGQVSTLMGSGIVGPPGNVLLPPGTVTIFDHFGTRNEFYGAQIGARGEYNAGRLVVSALGKIALGSTHEVVNLSGFTSGTGAALTPGGLLVLSSNIGRRAHDEFAVVPEIGINVGYQICRGVQAFVGYTFLYWSDVARPGDQINRTINSTLIPASRTFNMANAMGPAEPSFSFQRTDFWAQGVNFGLAFRF